MLTPRILVDASHEKELQVRAIANRNYKGRSDKELSLTKGQLVYLTNRLDYHWYLGRVQGGADKIGLMPASYLDIIATKGALDLPMVPDWAIKRTVTLDLTENNMEADGDKEQR